jgi:hypothetical protein
MLDLEQNPPPVRYLDLPSLCKEKGEKSELHLFFGTKPDAGTHESVNLDVLHAMRYQALPSCHLHPYADADHTIVRHLIDTRQINDILGKYIMDLEVPALSPANGLPVEWIAWMQKNLALGAPPDELLAAVTGHGFSEYDARVALYRCQKK